MKHKTRRNSHRRAKRKTRRKGGNIRKYVRRRKSSRMKRGGAIPEYFRNSMFLLNAQLLRDTYWGTCYSGNVYGPPFDDKSSKIMVVGEKVDPGTRIYLRNVLHDGRPLFDDWYAYIEVKGKNADDGPQRFYISDNTIVKRCSFGYVNRVDTGGACSGSPASQSEFKPKKEWPPTVTWASPSKWLSKDELAKRPDIDASSGTGKVIHGASSWWLPS